MNFHLKFCRLINNKKSELAGKQPNIGHPIVAHHLINDWVKAKDMIHDRSNTKGDSKTHFEMIDIYNRPMSNIDCFCMICTQVLFTLYI